MRKDVERRFLQAAVAVASLIPLSAGLAGIVEGPSMVKGQVPQSWPDLESHFRYLSGLLLGIGLVFIASIPTIERRSGTFAALTAIVLVGGLGRLSALPGHESPSLPHLLALGMELLAMPLIFLWQRRVARLCAAL